MVINEIDIGYMTIFKAKCKSPVSRYRNAPVGLPPPFQWMDSITGKFHIRWLTGVIQISQGDKEPFHC